MQALDGARQGGWEDRRGARENTRVLRGGQTSEYRRGDHVSGRYRRRRRSVIASAAYGLIFGRAALAHLACRYGAAAIPGAAAAVWRDVHSRSLASAAHILHGQ